MKKNIYILLFGLLLSMGVTSCDNNTDLLFDETAAQRKSGANKAYNDALKSSEQGWLFQYFPEETQKYGGYNFVLKFAEKGQVTVWSENMADLTKPETSMYDVISYGGPVLTFNTYNSIMHEFANPSRAEYLGKGGDYEFLIISHENDVITLKGIKTGNILKMTKMTEPADTYLAKVKAVSKSFRGATLEATINGSKVDINLNDHRMVFSYTENKEVKSEKGAFISTPTGVRFYKPLSLMGTTVEELVFNFATKQFASANAEVKINLVYYPVDLAKEKWFINILKGADRCVAIKTAWDKAFEVNKKAYKETLLPMVGVGNSITGNKDIGFSMLSSTGKRNWGIHFNLKFERDKKQPENLHISKLKSGLNWKYYTHLTPLLDIITDNSPFKTEEDFIGDPTQVKLTSVADPTVWFILRK